MKTPFLLFSLFIAVGAAAQSAKHRPVAGTNYSLVPPAGFEAAAAFSGFQNKKTGASILITELPTPVETIREGFTETALKKQGMTLLEKKTVESRQGPATLFTVTQTANGKLYRKQILLFGDAQKSVMVNGTYPDEAKAQAPVMTAALLSTVYNEKQGNEPVTNYTINVKGTGLQPARQIAGGTIYTGDGKIPSRKPMLVVAASISKVSITDTRQYSLDRLRKLPRGESNQVKEIKPVTINKLSGYEIVAHGKTPEGQDELVYQVMLFPGGGDYFLILGTTLESFDANLKTFRRIAQSFRRK